MRFYLLLDRLAGRLSYVNKILLVCFIGVHIPMIGAVAFVLLGSDLALGSLWGVLLALLVATLVGTLATCVSLYALLAPVRQASRAINTYLVEKTVPQLPVNHGDEAGVLMANIQEGITRLDAALDATTARAATALRDKQATLGLISGLSHEFRTPLNHIIGFAEMMSSEALGPLGQAAYKGYAGDIGQSGGKLLDTLQAVLDLSQAETANDSVAPQSLSLAGAASSALALVHMEAQRAGVGVRFLVPQDATVFADPRGLKQMLLHVLRLAIGSAGAGKTVLVSGRVAAGVATLEVSHDGKPWVLDEVPADLRASLPDATGYSAANEAFASVDPNALRLSLVRKLAEVGGGSVALGKSATNGRALRLNLPAVAGVRLALAS